MSENLQHLQQCGGMEFSSQPFPVLSCLWLANVSSSGFQVWFSPSAITTRRTSSPVRVLDHPCLIASAQWWLSLRLCAESWYALLSSAYQTGLALDAATCLDTPASLCWPALCDAVDRCSRWVVDQLKPGKPWEPDTQTSSQTFGHGSTTLFCSISYRLCGGCIMTCVRHVTSSATPGFCCFYMLFPACHHKLGFTTSSCEPRHRP